MIAAATPTIHLARVYELLIATYGEPQNEPDNDPLGGLVGAILSQHTSDINSERAYQQLVAAFPTWEEVRDAPTHEVARAIRCGGLANIKAPRIQGALLTLTEKQFELSLVPSRLTSLHNIRYGIRNCTRWSSFFLLVYVAILFDIPC